MFCDVNVVPPQVTKSQRISNMCPVMRKPDFAYVKTKAQISCSVTAQLISAFVFATWIEQSLFSLNPKFQASSLLLLLFLSVCVGPGNPKDRFSNETAYMITDQ